MPQAAVNGVDLYYEDTGEGYPVVFCHELAGDARSWDPQVNAFSRIYRCITFSYRGFPPSSVPEEPEAYSLDIQIEDLRALLDELGIEQAHIVGLSLGANLALHFAFRYPEYCRSIVVAGCGTGSTNRERFEQDLDEMVALLGKKDMGAFADVYSLGPSRLPYKRKDPKGWDVFRRQLAEHSAVGTALTVLGILRPRPTIFALQEQLRNLEVPALILIGDEDEPCVDPAVFMKREIPVCGLVVIPQSGHTINLEEPEKFNRAVDDFLRMVEAGRWASRVPISTSLMPQSAHS